MLSMVTYCSNITLHSVGCPFSGKKYDEMSIAEKHAVVQFIKKMTQ